jgi:hypothetical protein
MKGSNTKEKEAINTASLRKAVFFQPKLTINQPNDIYEQEADAMADKVMRMTDHETVQTKFFKPAISTVQREEAAPATDLPGDVPEAPAGTFFTPDSRGISNNKDSKISLDVHIDYLPSHTYLHVFIATEAGGSHKPGAPIQIIGDPGKGGDYTVTLSPVPSRFFLRFEARSTRTNLNVPQIRGTYVINLD